MTFTWPIHSVTYRISKQIPLIIINQASVGMNIPAFPLSSGSVDRARTLLNDTQSNFNQIHTVGYGNKSDFISIELRPKPNLSTETTCRAQRPLSHEHSAGSVHDQVFGEHRAASGKRGVQSGHRRGSLARPRRARCGWCYGRVTRHVRRHALLGCGLHLVRVKARVRVVIRACSR